MHDAQNPTYCDADEFAKVGGVDLQRLENVIKLPVTRVSSRITRSGQCNLGREALVGRCFTSGPT